MKKLYCYIQSRNGGYDVFEYTQNGKFVFYANYKSETEANDVICKLST